MLDLIIVIYLNVAIKNSLYLWLIQFVSKIYNDHTDPLKHYIHQRSFGFVICKMQALAASAYSSNLWSQSLVTLSVQAAVHQLDIWPINIDSCHDCWRVLHAVRLGELQKIYDRQISKIQRIFYLPTAWPEKLPSAIRIKSSALNLFFFSFFSYDKQQYTYIYILVLLYILIYSLFSVLCIFFCDNFHSAYNISLVALHCLMSSLADS